MLDHNQPILCVQQPWEEAVPYFVERIRQAGMQVVRTFDLKETRIGALSCSCPDHGSGQCDCQMVILLVYGRENQPVSLVVYSRQGQTWFSLVEVMGGTNVRLEAQLRSIFMPAEGNTPP